MTWLTHARFRKDLSAYLDGELSPRRAVTLESHVAACAACRSLLEDLRLASAALAELPQADTPRSFALRPEQLMQPRPVHRAPTPGLMAGSRIAVAALTCALAAVVFVDIGNVGENQGSGGTARPAAELASDSYTAYDGATSVPKAVETEAAPGTPACAGCSGASSAGGSSGASSAGGSEAPGLATAPAADAIGGPPSDDDGTSSGVTTGVGSAPDVPTQVPSTPIGDRSEPAEGLSPTAEPMPTLTPTPAPPTPGANADLDAAAATTAAAARVQTTNGLPEGSPSALSGGAAQAQADNGTDTLLLIEIGLAAALFMALAASAALAMAGRRRL